MHRSSVFSSSYYRWVGILFLLVVFAHSAYLHRVPGLLGDEASEGDNVYQLLQSEKLVITGERSYIGPVIDYVRVPFIGLFGYTPFALRLPILLATGISFWIAANVFRKIFGDIPSLFALTFFFFSPVYLLYYRLGWAITLIPFFAFLLLFFLLKDPNESRSAPLLAGLTAGLGLANHLLFFPTLIAVLVGWGISYMVRPRKLLTWWPALIGFWAGFGMQFAVLQLWTEDQGDPDKITSLFTERLSVIPEVLHRFLSGSVYIAGYIGHGISPLTAAGITLVLTVCIACAVLFSRHRTAVSLWVIAMIVQVLALIYMVDRFTLRYFAPLVLAFWIISGVGFGSMLERITKRMPTAAYTVAFLMALVLIIFTTTTTLLPYLRTGGSLETIDLGNHTESAAALVDTRPLLACIHNKGIVYSENIHIYNRLIFWNHQYPDVVVAPDKNTADWLIHYRNDMKDTSLPEVCPDLTHFAVVKNNKKPNP